MTKPYPPSTGSDHYL